MNFSQEELDQQLVILKKQHSKVYSIEVLLDDTEENKCTIFLKHPERQVYSQVSKYLGGSDPLKASEIFIKSTYIGGDDVSLILSNDYALRSLDSSIAEIMYVKQSSLKKN
jgi:hypothetical protein